MLCCASLGKEAFDNVNAQCFTMRCTRSDRAAEKKRGIERFSRSIVVAVVLISFFSFLRRFRCRRSSEWGT
jgi:hypothetical protein